MTTFLDEPESQATLVHRIRVLSYRFQSLQSMAVALALNPKEDTKFKLGTMMLMGHRQEALRELILTLDNASRSFTIEQNRASCVAALKVFSSAWDVANEAEKTSTSLN